MKTNIVFFVCDCTGHAVGVEREDFDDEPVVCISYWQRNPQQASFWARTERWVDGISGTPYARSFVVRSQREAICTANN